MPLGLYTVLQLLIAVLAVLALRTVIAVALLHEAGGEAGEHSVGHEEVSCAATQVRKSSYLSVLGPMIAGVGVAVASAVVVSILITPAPTTVVCPPDCGKPPFGDPVETNPRFSGDNGAFSVSYPGEGSAYEATFDPPGSTV